MTTIQRNKSSTVLTTTIRVVMYVLVLRIALLTKSEMWAQDKETCKEE